VNEHARGVDRFADYRRYRSVLKRGFYVIVSVLRLAVNGKEKVARIQGARVDAPSGYRRGRQSGRRRGYQGIANFGKGKLQVSSPLIRMAKKSRRPKDAPGNFAVVERDRTIFQNLIRLVSLSRQNHHVARLRFLNGAANRFFPIRLRYVRGVEAP
jgi:hypothetical protein